MEDRIKWEEEKVKLVKIAEAANNLVLADYDAENERDLLNNLIKDWKDGIS